MKPLTNPRDIYTENIANALENAEHWDDATVKRMLRRAKRKAWLHAEVKFEFVNRWKDWLKYPDFYVLWLGTELQRGDDYKKFMDQWSFDITIANFGFKVKVRAQDAWFDPYWYMPHQAEKPTSQKPD